MMSGAVCAKRFQRLAALVLILLATCVLAAGQTVGTPPSSGGVQGTSQGARTSPGLQPGSPMIIESPPISRPLTLKQKDAIVKANFKSTQRDVAKLSKLVQNLDQEMKKSNPDVLSLGIVKQAEKIEKLAKKIKNEAKSY